MIRSVILGEREERVSFGVDEVGKEHLIELIPWPELDDQGAFIHIHIALVLIQGQAESPCIGIQPRKHNCYLIFFILVDVGVRHLDCGFD